MAVVTSFLLLSYVLADLKAFCAQAMLHMSHEASAVFTGLACMGEQQCHSSYLPLCAHHVMNVALTVALQHRFVHTEHPSEAATATMYKVQHSGHVNSGQHLFGMQNVWSEVLRCVSRWELLQQLHSGGPTDALLFSPAPAESPASNPLMKLRDRLLMRAPAAARPFGGDMH